MLSEYAFFTFSHLSDPARHQEFNAWHQLDHRPENLALPGIAWGERWVRTPACRALGDVADESLDAVEYMNMYWLRAPVERSVASFLALGDQCAQWGRRPDLAYTVRDIIGYFRPVKTYVDPDALVSPQALPLRPTRGVYVTMTQTATDSAPAVDGLNAWYDRVRLPDLVACPGIAGACTFVSDPTRSGGEVRGAPAGLRLHLYYLDAPPTDVAATVDDALRRAAAEGRDLSRAHVETPVFEGWFETIQPWHWDWFDPAPST